MGSGAPVAVDNSHPSDPTGPTGRLANWISETTLQNVPSHIQTRAKHIILDGIACLLVGAHLPGSEVAARAIFDMEAPGTCTVFGWGGRKLSPLQAALLNSTFIQGFEIDDWHSEAPLHSNSLLLPALLAAAEHDASSELSTNKVTTGSDLLLATIVGFEVGPRVGLGLHGAHALTMGWHSGAIFGPSAAAASTSKLLGLTPSQIEDALGIACTQAGGLMSAQFGSDVKRMQHGFAARNGLFGTLLSRGGYTGIKRVYEENYGGFLACFTRGNGKQPAYLSEEVAKELGTTWKIEGIRLKAYCGMAGTHCTVDCLRELQAKYLSQMKDFRKIKEIKIELGEAAFHHGGWLPKRPLTATGAQMSNAYVAATQIIDYAVSPLQFRQDNLDRDEIWDLVGKVNCMEAKDRDLKFGQRVTVTFQGGNGDQASDPIVSELPGPRGVFPELSNEEIIEKWRLLVTPLIDDSRRQKIEDLILNLESREHLKELIELLSLPTKNPLA
ncbi:uncharacterized protein A1O9_11067 [Exophiala aquamarina CBS 119918]|uniref:Immune-responsive protein 1 n=1 Tax=Exophiala aquamarina CBS 119918 TaxID=1182545 RepID=A0A072PAN9_9EURO|nr:uncharacterized protein A1O9_11067 [Exophiala aquamarina CBS 119918]KEF52650.1 hypothetical protein A1O9_11067 [Exophiala aquamarina CBS 119918]